jgi:hypothetical protein
MESPNGLNDTTHTPPPPLSFYNTFKVAQCEILGGTDFHFHFNERATLGLKYKLVILILVGARHHLISDAHAEHMHSVPDAYTQCMYQFLIGCPSKLVSIRNNQNSNRN